MEHLKKTISFLIFSLDNELFALNVHSVLEVLENQTITSVPNTPEHVKGVLNFRGDILPIIDMREILNLNFNNKEEVIIVLDLNKQKHSLRIGAVADGVMGVILVPELSIEAIPDLNLSFSKEFLEGMFNYDGKFIKVIDVNKVFTLENIMV